MKIYHYSAGDYQTLRTLKKQHEVSGKKIVLPEYAGDDYGGHISFFFDRVPLDILGGIFGKNHHTWFPGSSLLEYTIDVDRIGKFRYHITETPEKTKLYYDESLSIEQYHKRLDDVEKEYGYIGNNAAAFIEASKKLIGGTRHAFMELPFRSNWSSIRGKYAATVPHVMLYPETGEVLYQSKRHVRVR